MSKCCATSRIEHTDHPEKVIERTRVYTVQCSLALGHAGPHWDEEWTTSGTTLGRWLGPGDDRAGERNGRGRPRGSVDGLVEGRRVGRPADGSSRPSRQVEEKVK